ncbi:sulfite exporter TauE/SafE family protein [Phosphitispora sp. TUW77]|uniref:sulfite exporter TauE/SafE family protein n=1 Tax=Phosphitispora sp. TUW77 TaxID=3152361 RepID=UPI003AB17710
MKHISLLIIIMIGIITGLINGLLGIGGGTILIPAMVFFMGITQHQAHGTSLAVILPTTLASCLIYGLNHDLNLNLTIQVIAGSIGGGYLGAKLLNKIPAPKLRRFFGIFMFLAGLRMML